ncbi:MAG TPA: glucose-6-phosphate isomerase [Chloroflexi bacterium]|nr:glucose-6-phosphate isomerase [Chloroflexota bacterium]
MELTKELFTRLDPTAGVIEGKSVSARRLSDLKGLFADEAAFDQALQEGDPVIYETSGVESASGEGDLHYAAGKILPGKIGREYFMTKGHYHAWKPAAEVYIGFQGRGVMLLESEDGRQVELVPLEANSIVYVPGNTAHRTINIGDEPLTYIGIYPARAGHDYGSIAVKNFAHVVVEVDGEPRLMKREDFLKEIAINKEL